MLKIALILVTGIAAGFINTLAGGGSLLTMPMLIFMGLPSAVANGTNRIGIMIQSIVAITNFREKGYFDWKYGVKLGIPAIIGSIVGSNIAIDLRDDVFNKILAFVMIVVLVFIIWQPQKKIITKYDKKIGKKKELIALVIFFFVGVYGGLIQAGIGFIIILSLTLITGVSLVKINSLKVFIVGLYMISSLLVFIMNGKVNWALGFTLAVGNGIGGYIGSNFAVKKGDKWIKIVLAVSVVIMAAKLLGVFA